MICRHQRLTWTILPYAILATSDTSHGNVGHSCATAGGSECEHADDSYLSSVTLMQTQLHRGLQIPVNAQTLEKVTCRCATPNQGTAGKNGYLCTDGTSGWCPPTDACFTTTSFAKSVAFKLCDESKAGQDPVVTPTHAKVTCRCATPNQGTAGKNGYLCTDGTSGWCPPTDACFTTTAFAKSDAFNLCESGQTRAEPPTPAPVLKEVTDLKAKVDDNGEKETTHVAQQGEATCTCMNPNQGTAGKNGYQCSDGTTWYCEPTDVCFTKTSFSRSDGLKQCKTPEGDFSFACPASISNCRENTCDMAGSMCGRCSSGYFWDIDKCKETPKGQRYADCFDAGHDLQSRDASCAGQLKCARKGSDGRNFGDCDNTHCCSVEVKGFDSKVGRFACDEKDLLYSGTDFTSEESVQRKCQELNCATYSWSSDGGDSKYGAWFCKVDSYDGINNAARWPHFKSGRPNTAFTSKAGRGSCPPEHTIENSIGYVTERSVQDRCDALECIFYVWSYDDTDNKGSAWFCTTDYYDTVDNGEKFHSWKVGRSLQAFTSKVGRGACPVEHTIENSIGHINERSVRDRCDELQCAFYVWSDDDTDNKGSAWFCSTDYYDTVDNGKQYGRWKVGRPSQSKAAKDSVEISSSKEDTPSESSEPTDVVEEPEPSKAAEDSTDISSPKEDTPSESSEPTDVIEEAEPSKTAEDSAEISSPKEDTPSESSEPTDVVEEAEPSKTAEDNAEISSPKVDTLSESSEPRDLVEEPEPKHVGNDATSNCTDTNSKWEDANGRNCSWYAQDTKNRCKLALESLSGKRGEKVCCACGGGFPEEMGRDDLAEMKELLVEATKFAGDDMSEKVLKEIENATKQGKDPADLLIAGGLDHKAAIEAIEQVSVFRSPDQEMNMTGSFITERLLRELSKANESLEEAPTKLPAVQGDMVARHKDEYVSLLRAIGKREHFARNLWKNPGHIPYCFSNNIAPASKTAFQDAIQHFIDHVPCLGFVEVEVGDENFETCSEQPGIFVKSDSQGCWAYVGEPHKSAAGVYGPSTTNLAPDGCDMMGIAAHELGHNIGLLHVQSRPDRDDYVKIYWQNIKKAYWSQYEMDSVPDSMNRDVDGDVKYDIMSLMHYGDDFFAELDEHGLPKKTMVAKQESSRAMGNRQGLTSADVIQVSSMYGCFSQAEAYFKVCTMKEDACTDSQCVCHQGSGFFKSTKVVGGKACHQCVQHCPMFPTGSSSFCGCPAGCKEGQFMSGGKKYRYCKGHCTLAALATPSDLNHEADATQAQGSSHKGNSEVIWFVMGSVVLFMVLAIGIMIIASIFWTAGQKIKQMREDDEDI